MWHGYTQLVAMAFAFELRDEYGWPHTDDKCSTICGARVELALPCPHYSFWTIPAPSRRFSARR